MCLLFAIAAGCALAAVLGGVSGMVWGAVLAVALLILFSKLFPPDPLPLALADDDPLIALARDKAQETLPALRELFVARPKHTLVKIPFRTDKDQVEHVWAQLNSISADRMEVWIESTPVTQESKLDRNQTVPISELEDWTVSMPDSTIRGGFTQKVLMIRMKQRDGKLPPEIESQQGIFPDHRDWNPEDPKAQK